MSVDRPKILMPIFNLLATLLHDIVEPPNIIFNSFHLRVDVKGFASTYDTQTEKVNTRNQVKTAGSPGKSRPKLLVQKYIPSSQTVTGGAGLPTHSSLEYKEGYVHTQG